MSLANRFNPYQWYVWLQRKGEYFNRLNFQCKIRRTYQYYIPAGVFFHIQCRRVLSYNYLTVYSKSMTIIFISMNDNIVKGVSLSLGFRICFIFVSMFVCRFLCLFGFLLIYLFFTIICLVSWLLVFCMFLFSFLFIRLPVFFVGLFFSSF